MADESAKSAFRRRASARPHIRAGDLLYGVAAVLAATVAERVAQSTAASQGALSGSGLWVFHLMTLGVLAAMALGCLLVAARQWSLTLGSSATWRGVGMSAAVGALLLTGAAVIISVTTLGAIGPNLMGVIIIIICCSVALGLGALFQLGAQAMTRESAPLPMSAQGSSRGYEPRRPPPARPGALFPEASPLRSEQVNMPPLFGDDPLYAVPKPRTLRLFIHPKGSGSPVECDDACAIDEQKSYFALCDGTGASALPRPWAAMLAHKWVAEPFMELPDAESLAAWIDPLRQRWRQWVQDIWLPTLNARYAQLGQTLLPEQRADDVIKVGASSTFLGLRLIEAPHERLIIWQSIAIGDTCTLLFRRDGAILRPTGGFPIEHAADFNDRPPSLPSRPGDDGALAAGFRVRSGACSQGDVLVMASDALAKWLLTSIEQESDGWRALLDNQDTAWFDWFVEQERARGALEDDDTTLLVIPINGPYPQESSASR